ncbi:MAG TPA: lipid-A-disaccharide synthase [Candidatus Omnitrophota bacterium]|jgi:lipid-A-disaccharide synthase|nr:lipid-A-disaccharide synthase [Candidatus Omnitrophota bacterium]HPW64668.1 lipid-A-disaccharide synthase [Candidatus Omnitrophota bacterium]HQB93589.1 lipid-A-disaccharide synthase [Candidatus Omnitrophota bacterium]
MPKKIFIIACEASADRHGAHLVAELRKFLPDTEFCGHGGSKMAAAGVRVFHDMTKISALGFGDVIRNYLTYRKIFHDTIALIGKERPDILVTVDAPAFNLRLAKKVSKLVPIFYFISPQLWAWGKRRIHIIKKHVREMLVIFPFEKDFYEKEGVAVKFVGHPLLDALPGLPDSSTLRSRFGIPSRTKVIGLFSGSREKEVKRILPVMLQSAALIRKEMSAVSFIVSKSPNVRPQVYDEILKASSLPVLTPPGSFYELVKCADFALVTSGTATLETALLDTPFFLLYKTGAVTYFLGKRLIKVPYLGIVNLLANNRVVPEFIQQDARPETIARETRVFLNDPELQARMKEEFRRVRESLGEKGASRRAAKEICDFLATRPN